MYDKQKYMDWCIYSGINTSIEMGKLNYCKNTGCNADGFGLKFVYDPDEEEVYVKKLLPCGKYKDIGIGSELQESLVKKYGTVDNLESVVMDRLHTLWGGVENYKKLFGNMKGHHDYDFVDTFCWRCSCRLSDNRILCVKCSREEH